MGNCKFQYVWGCVVFLLISRVWFAVTVPITGLFKDQQIKTAADIPDSYFEQKKTLLCLVVNIADGDTIRCRAVRHCKIGDEEADVLKKDKANRSKPWKGQLKEQSVLIRLYAVDAPETAKFGKPGQPFAPEATEFVRKACNAKVVEVKLLSKDIYGRAVAGVYYKAEKNAWNFWSASKRDLSMDLIEAGLGDVYTSGGAQYDDKLNEFLKQMEKAKRKKRGMWSQNSTVLVTPEEYKRQNRKP